MSPMASFLAGPSPDPRVSEAAASVSALISQQISPRVPRVGVVLGSGLGGVAESIAERVDIPYSSIPHFRAPTVAGHGGTLSFGRLGAANVVCLRGRIHLYEGHSVEDVVFGCRLLGALGCGAVLLTNAAGGIRSGLAPGSLMMLTDHLNLTGNNPLAGAGYSFVNLTRAYDRPLRDAALRAARESSITLHEGVYAGLLGPSYETPAEIRMLRALGADAVGMSTVMETDRASAARSTCRRDELHHQSRSGTVGRDSLSPRSRGDGATVARRFRDPARALGRARGRSPSFGGVTW